MSFLPDVDLVHSSVGNETLDDLVERRELTNDRLSDAVVAALVPGGPG